MTLTDGKNIVPSHRGKRISTKQKRTETTQRRLLPPPPHRRPQDTNAHLVWEVYHGAAVDERDDRVPLELRPIALDLFARAITNGVIFGKASLYPLLIEGGLSTLRLTAK